MCVGIVISTNVTYYMLLTYMPSYLSHNLHYSEDHGVLIIIAIMIGMLFVQPVIGLTSDRIGRKPFIIGGSIGLLALAIPCFILINSNVIGLIFVGLLVLAVLLNSFTGVMASILPAMFPTHPLQRAGDFVQHFGADRRCDADRRRLAGRSDRQPVHAGLLSDGRGGDRSYHRSVHERNRQQTAARRDAGCI